MTARDGESHDVCGADATGLPATLEADELTALDASALFPALAPGVDVIAAAEPRRVPFADRSPC